MKGTKPQASRKPVTKTTSTEIKQLPALLAGIAVITLLAYLPALKNGFVWDDQYYVLSNTLAQSFSIPGIFSSFLGGNYHPVTVFVFALQYHLFGTSPMGYHAVNLALHLANTLLVFLFLRRLTDRPEVALVAALLFGIHPLHVESVAWVSGLKDLLYTAFFLGSCIFYINFTKSGKRSEYLVALLLFLLAMLSKAMAAPLPFVLILIDFFRGRKITLRSLSEKVPFLIIAVILGIVAVIAQKSSDFIQEPGAYSMLQRIAFAGFGFTAYLVKLVLPLNLSAWYPYPSPGAVPGWYYLGLLAFPALAFVIYYSLRKGRLIAFGLGFFTLMLAMVLQLLPVGDALMADRYSYVPSIGIFLLAGAAFARLRERRKTAPAVAALALFTLFFPVVTFARCGVWNNGLTLWNDVIGKYPAIPSAWYNRGVYKMNQGDDRAAAEDFGKAIGLAPRHADAYNNRGTILMNHDRNDQALADFNKAIELKPGMAKAFYNRGVVYMKLGQNDRAAADFSEAVRLNLVDFETLVNRGYVLTALGRYPEALKDYNAAIDLKPDDVQGYLNRGYLHMMMKNNGASAKDYVKVTQLDPGKAVAWQNLGLLYYSEGKNEEAILHFTKAIELEPRYIDAYYYRGMAEKALGRSDEAGRDLKKAALGGSVAAAEALGK